MSLLWPERITLYIGPSGLSLTRSRQAVTWHPLKQGDWVAGLRALPALPRFSRLSVCVADCYARYLCLTWPPGLKAAEREAFLSHRFQAVFGVSADGWIMLADRDAVVHAFLAAALPRALVETVKAFCQHRRLRLACITPAFIRDYNRFSHRFVADGAYSRLEDGRLTLGLWRNGRWLSVRSQAAPQAQDAIGACLAGLLPILSAKGESVRTGTLYVNGDGALSLPEGWLSVGLGEAS